MDETRERTGCVLFAERHGGLIEGVRGLLETAFQHVYIVSDDASLIEGAGRLQPDVVVADLSLAAGDLPHLVQRVKQGAPSAKVLILSGYTHPTIARSVAAAGADGFVSKRSIATELLDAIDVVREGRAYLSRAAARPA